MVSLRMVFCLKKENDMKPKTKELFRKMFRFLPDERKKLCEIAVVNVKVEKAADQTARGAVGRVFSDGLDGRSVREGFDDFLGATGD